MGGESRVGKSRLLDELRTHALVEGMRVLRGQTTQEPGHGLAIFADVVRALALTVPLSEADVAVLTRLVPDLDRVLELPKAVPLRRQAPAVRPRGRSCSRR